MGAKGRGRGKGRGKGSLDDLIWGRLPQLHEMEVMMNGNWWGARIGSCHHRIHLELMGVHKIIGKFGPEDVPLRFGKSVDGLVHCSHLSFG